MSSSAQLDEGVPLHLFELGESATKGRHPAKRSGGGAVPQRRGEPGVQEACPLPEADFLTSSTRSDPRSAASSAHRLAIRRAATSHSLPDGEQDVSPTRMRGGTEGNPTQVGRTQCHGGRDHIQEAALVVLNHHPLWILAVTSVPSRRRPGTSVPIRFTPSSPPWSVTFPIRAD